MSETAQTTSDEWAPVLLGRFGAELPSSLQRVGDQHHIQNVMIEELPWADSLSADEAFAQKWQSSMATLRERTPKGIDDAGDVIVEKRDLSPHAKAVLYHRGVTPEQLMWHVLLQRDKAGVTFQKNTRQGQAADDFDVVKRVVKAYKLGFPSNDAQGWFHIDEGGVERSVQDSEFVSARFEGGGSEIKFEFDTIPKPAAPSFLERVFSGFWKAAARKLGLSINMIRQRQRTVAEREGKEEVYTYTEDGQKRIRLWWFYPGKPNDGRYPQIEIEWDTPGGNVQHKLEDWDRILGSMHLMSANNE